MLLDRGLVWREEKERKENVCFKSSFERISSKRS